MSALQRLSRWSGTTLSTVLALGFSAGLAPAAETGDPGPLFIDRSEEGWFWYEDPPEEPEPEPKTAPTSPTPPDTATASATPAGPTPLSARWLAENLEGYRERAVDHPSPDNVRAYLYLQRVAMDKASAFAKATQAVTAGDPFLDANAERPIASFGAQAMDAQAHQAGRALLSHLAQSTGLVFFYQSDCPFCERQAPLLQALSRNTGLEVLAISIDGQALPSGHFADFVPNRGQAQALGVTTVPAIALMRPPDGVFLVTQGLHTLSELQRLILLKAREAGLIGEEAWEATLPVQRTTESLAPDDLGPALLDNPAALVAHLRQRMAASGATAPALPPTSIGVRR